MPRPNLPLAAPKYRIVVQSHLDETWLDAVGAVSMYTGYDERGIPTTTFLTGAVDQGQLIGFVNDLHGLGMQVISVQEEASACPGG